MMFLLTFTYLDITLPHSRQPYQTNPMESDTASGAITFDDLLNPTPAKLDLLWSSWHLEQDSAGSRKEELEKIEMLLGM